MNRKNILSLVVVFILTIVLLNGCDVLSELFGLNEPPIADAGPDQSDVIVGTLVTLDGSLSSDPDGDQLTYRWSFQAFGLGSTLHDDQIVHGTSKIAFFTPDVAGTWILELAVSDGVATVTDSATINVVAAEAGMFQFGAGSFAVDEAAGIVSISVKRAGGSDGAVSVDYATTNGTAIAGIDYSEAFGALNWADGESDSKSFDVSITDDSVYEDNETFMVVLSSPSGGAIVGTPNTATVTIADNESTSPGTLQFASATVTVSEDNPDVTISVTRAGGSDGAVSVDYATSGGTALSGSDFTAASGTLSWANGESGSKSFSVSIIDDVVYEGDQTFTVVLSGESGGATVGSPGTVTVTIADNESSAFGTLQFETSSFSVGEGEVNATIYVTRANGSDGAVSVNYVTSNGTALAGSDYTAGSGTLNWVNGETTSKSFSVSITNDSLYEGDETFIVALGGAAGGASVGSPGTAIVTIQDNDSPSSGTLEFSAASYSVDENGGSVTLSVLRTGGSDGSVSVNYATANGSALSGTDYTAASGTLNWAGGETGFKSFSVSIADDSVYEGNKTFTAALSGATGGASVGSPGTATVTIQENEAGSYGTLQFSASSYSVNESGVSVTLSVSRAGGSDGAVSVNYTASDGTAVGGSDYMAASGTLSWANGETTSKSFSVSITDDSLYEGNETFIVALGGAAGGASVGSPGTAAVTVEDNDSPSSGTLVFSAASYIVNENGAGVTLSVLRTDGSDGAVSVNYATANETALSGTNYTAATGTLSWAGGETGFKSFSVSIIDNVDYDLNKTFTVTLSGASGGASVGSPGTATVTIVEDEAPPASQNGTLQFSASSFTIGEDESNAIIYVTRANGSTGAVSVDYATSNGTAITGSDYTAASGTLSWADAETASKSFSVSVTDDSLYEGDETFILALNNATGGASVGSPGTAIVTIQDNETPSYGTLVFSAANYSVNENGGSVTLSVLRTGGSYGAVGVAYTTQNDSAVAVSDFTAASGTLSWANGESVSKSFSVSMIDDGVYEGNETFTVVLSGESGGASVGSPGTATVTIQDNETASYGTLQFSASSYSVNEGGASVTLSVSRTGGSDGAVSVTYTTNNGTALSGSDYTAISETLNWANGETGSKSITVSIIDDGIYEGAETFTVVLSGAGGGATVGSPGTAVVTIEDNESPSYGALMFSAAGYSVNENGGSVTLSVLRIDGSTGSVEVSYSTMNDSAAADSDYTATSGTLSWANGESGAKSFSVSIIDDGVYEGNETFAVALSGATNGASIAAPDIAIVTIQDNETASYGTLQFSASSYSVDETGASVMLSVSRTGGSDGAVNVTYATNNGTALSGGDYTAVSGTLSWANGDAGSKSITVSIIDDGIYEEAETFTVVLSGASGGATVGSPGTAVVTIQDNETPSYGSLQFSTLYYSVTEDGGSVTLSVLRTGGSDGAVTVHYASGNSTAFAGEDYAQAWGTLSWANGDAGVKNIIVSIINDGNEEGSEVFSVALSAPTGGANLGMLSGTDVIIEDDDAPVGSFDWANYQLTGRELSLRVVRIIDTTDLYKDMTLTAYALSDTEVTQGDYEKVMGVNPAAGTGYGEGPDYPVYRVSWFDGARFCNALSVLCGLEPVYNEEIWQADFTKNGFYLPTEAQWEYAAGGPYHYTWPQGNTFNAADYVCNGTTYTQPVKSKPANGFGIYAMAGNVWEWCHDWYGPGFPHSGETDPTGPASGTLRTLRGGGWDNAEYDLRCEQRSKLDPSISISTNVGFHIAVGGHGLWNR